MRYYLIVILLFKIVQGNAQSKKDFLIEGNITGLKNGVKLYLVKNKNGEKELDTFSTAVLKNGKFNFRGRIPLECEIYYLRLDSSISKKAKTIFLENQDIRIQGSIDQWPQKISITGSPSTDEYYGLLTILADPQKELDSCSKRLSEIRHLISSAENGTVTVYKDTQVLRRDEVELESKWEELKKEFYKVWIGYIDAHLNSLFIPQSIEKLSPYLGVSGTISTYNKLTKRAQESFYGVQLKNHIANMRLRESAADSVKVGMKVQDFNMKTPQGDKLAFSEIVSSGKLTLIDFWAFWCKPCRAETPNLKKVYSAFHDKGFNIVSITSDPRELPWKKAIKDDGMDWFHGLSTEASAIFDISAIPAFVLVDREGKIIAMDIQGSSVVSGESGSLHGENLYNKIAELLK